MVALLIAFVLLLPSGLPLLSVTSVRIQLLDDHDAPVAGVTLTVRDSVQTMAAQTDASGFATLPGLSGTFLHVLDAVLPDGTHLRLEATTLDAGLRFGLLPDQERQVLLRRDGNVIFLDPTTIFAGSAPEDIQAPVATSDAPPVASNQPALSPGAQPFGLMILTVLLVPAGCWFVLWVLKIRAYRRSRR